MSDEIFFLIFFSTFNFSSLNYTFEENHYFMFELNINKLQKALRNVFLNVFSGKLLIIANIVKNDVTRSGKIILISH